MNNTLYMEILKMATKLLMNEYTDKKHNLHNQWLIESEHMWATRRLKVAYPVMPHHPTDEDILARAAKFLEFVSANDAQVDIDHTVNAPLEPIEEIIEQETEPTPLEPTVDVDVAIESPVPMSEPMELPSIVPVIELSACTTATTTATMTTVAVEPITDKKITRFGDLLPSVLKEISKFRETV